MCIREDSVVKTNFYKVRGVASINGKVLKVYYGGYCSDSREVAILGSKALDFFVDIMPKALEDYNYVPRELHSIDNIRNTPKGVCIEVALKGDVESNILKIATVMKTLETTINNDIESKSRAKHRALYTDYKAELDWNRKLLKALEECQDSQAVCKA
ncbi:hypothetical protein UT300012_21240 [Paraclostridium bifermentans]